METPQDSKFSSRTRTLALAGIVVGIAAVIAWTRWMNVRDTGTGAAAPAVAHERDPAPTPVDPTLTVAPEAGANATAQPAATSGGASAGAAAVAHNAGAGSTPPPAVVVATPPGADADLVARYGALDAAALAEQVRKANVAFAQAQADAFAVLVAQNRHHTIEVDMQNTEAAQAEVAAIERPDGVLVYQDTVVSPDTGRLCLRWGHLSSSEFPDVYALQRESQWLAEHAKH